MSDTHEPIDPIDPAVERFLARLRDESRRAPVPVDTRLAQLFADGVVAAPEPRRSARMKSIWAAKVAAAAAAVVAATGGLAVASALPAPFQSVASDAADIVGVHLPSSDDSAPEAATDETTTTEEPSTTTAPTTTTPAPTSTTVERADDPTDAAATGDTHPENHGAEVSAVARDKTKHRCEHGRAVSAIASGRTNDRPCPDHEADDDKNEATPPSTIDEAEPETGARDDRGPSHPHREGHGHGHGKNATND